LNYGVRTNARRTELQVSGKQAVLRKAIPLCGIVLVLGSLVVWSQSDGHQPVETQHAASLHSEELISVVQDFLKNVPANQRETYDRFFADDVIYTRNSGQVVAKKDILADAGNPAAPRANATFTGEDFIVHPYGEMAVVNFRLVMHGTENGNSVTRSFRNTGTFMKRKGRWQAVAWQATPIAAK
jgi:ketosteroid isomerase-like protein